MNRSEFLYTPAYLEQSSIKDYISRLCASQSLSELDELRSDLDACIDRLVDLKLKECRSSTRIESLDTYLERLMTSDDEKEIKLCAAKLKSRARVLYAGKRIDVQFQNP